MLSLFVFFSFLAVYTKAGDKNELLDTISRICVILGVLLTQDLRDAWTTDIEQLIRSESQGVAALVLDALADPKNFQKLACRIISSVAYVHDAIKISHIPFHTNFNFFYSLRYQTDGIPYAASTCNM